MANYLVSVIDRRGKRRSLREAAPDRAALRENLRARGLYLMRDRELDRARKLARLRIPAGEFVALLHQLELQLRAGVTADAALRQLAEDAPAGAMREMLGRIQGEVARGIPIHQACRFFERQFPPHLAAVIAAGESSARLPEALQALAENIAQAQELKRTARRALVYPGVVLVATSGLVVFLLGGVVPQFAAIFGSMHLELPWITVVLIRASAGLREHGVLFGIGFGLLVASAVAAGRLRRLRTWRDAALLRVPVLGETLRCLAVARFAAHGRLMLESGIPVLEALETGTELMHSAVLEAQLRKARQAVASGRALYASLPKRHAFPDFFVPALKSGETSGQLPAALRHIEDYAAQRAKERLAVALALLEPLVLCFLTVVVGGVALSFFLPLFSLLGGLNGR